MWESKELGVSRRNFQDRFRIYYEQLDLFSSEARPFWKDEYEEMEEGLMFKQGFARELLSCMGDHLSIADLQQIVEVFQEEYDKREAVRQEHIKKPEVDIAKIMRDFRNSAYPDGEE